MVKVDLITGFLGSGKTTFIKYYLKYLKSQGEKVHIIENEFGATSIDKHLVEEAEEDCMVSDLSGMCMCCIGKSAFIKMLIESSQNGCDRIVVEPSGIYDVDEFFDVLSDSRVCQYCEIGMIATIVDPFQGEELTDEVRYLMYTQLIASGKILLSKTQLADKETLDKSVSFIKNLLEEKGYGFDISDQLIFKNWDSLTEDDFEEMQDEGYNRLVHDEEVFLHSEVFTSIDRSPDFENLEDIKKRTNALFSSPEAGKIFRIKGFARTADGNFYEVNSTGSFCSVEATSVCENKLVIIGQKLKSKNIVL